MKDELARKPRQRQRGRVYGHEVDGATGVIVETQDYILSCLPSRAIELHPDDEAEFLNSLCTAFSKTRSRVVR
jgi:hypothetical protein